MAKVKNLEEIWRLDSPSASADGTDYALVGLVAVIDLDEDGRRMHRPAFLFADHAGLEAEYGGDTGTTVIEALIVAYLSALPASADEDLPPSYAGWVEHTEAWAP